VHARSVTPATGAAEAGYRRIPPESADARGLSSRERRRAAGVGGVRPRRACEVVLPLVYLDVGFLHPFEDGNARAAWLALDHVLTRAGLGPRAVEPLFGISRAADDARGAWCFASMVDHLNETAC